MDEEIGLNEGWAFNPFLYELKGLNEGNIYKE